MCTIIILRRPGHEWPILIAANRDERHNRPASPPARHWPDRPEIVAGLDQLAGGSWLGINDAGLVAAALNRQGTLGPAAGKRSRGELVLDALDFADAADAADALAALDPAAYRPFNLVLADNRDAFLLSHRAESGHSQISVEPLPPGLSMVTALDRNDQSAPRIRHFLPLFDAAAPPDPFKGDWTAWIQLLGRRDSEPGAGPAGSLFIDGTPPDAPDRFGTVSSSLIALPSFDRPEFPPIWRFADGKPEDWNWRDVALD